jgi:hypothetical protein
MLSYEGRIKAVQINSHHCILAIYSEIYYWKDYRWVQNHKRPLRILPVLIVFNSLTLKPLNWEDLAEEWLHNHIIDNFHQCSELFTSCTYSMHCQLASYMHILFCRLVLYCSTGTIFFRFFFFYTCHILMNFPYSTSHIKNEIHF